MVWGLSFSCALNSIFGALRCAGCPSTQGRPDYRKWAMITFQLLSRRRARAKCQRFTLHLRSPSRRANWRSGSSRPPGPGGQNVNKVATAVQLRFDVARSPSLPEEVRRRLMGLAGRRLTQERCPGTDCRPASHPGAQSCGGSRAAGRVDPAGRIAPKPRKATRPTLASKQRRLKAKTVRSAL